MPPQSEKNLFKAFDGIALPKLERSGATVSPGVGARERYSFQMQIADRITVDADRCGGRPCVRGMRIRVSDVLGLFASGLTAEKILEDLPDLEPEDIHACLNFAAGYLDHPVLVA